MTPEEIKIADTVRQSLDDLVASSDEEIRAIARSHMVRCALKIAGLYSPDAFARVFYETL